MTPPQAIERLRQVLRRQHKALSTEDTYVFWVRRYICALRTMPKALSSEKKLEQFLTGLALHQNVAASTQNQAFNAVVFFYKDVLGQPLGNVGALRAKRVWLAYCNAEITCLSFLCALRDLGVR